MDSYTAPPSPGERPAPVPADAEPEGPSAALPGSEEWLPARRLRDQLLEVVAELDSVVNGLGAERADLDREIQAAQTERDALSRIAALDERVLQRVIEWARLENAIGG